MTMAQTCFLAFRALFLTYIKDIVCEHNTF